MLRRNLNIVLCGTGTVGGTLLGQIAQQQDALLANRALDIKVVGVADIFNVIADKDGIDLKTYLDADMNFSYDDFNKMFRAAEKSSLKQISDATLQLAQQGVKDMVFVDCTASYEVADLYMDFLSNGISVVCANKVAASGDINNYKKLKQTAFDNNCYYRFETNVGAGLPIINTINALRDTGDKVGKIEAVLSGTLNYIFNTISDEVKFSEAVLQAKEARFAEPDPRIDLSGVDVIRKLVILARESGVDISQEDVEKHLFVPDEYFEGSLDDFWRRLPELDAHFDELRKDVESKQQHLRFVAKLEDGKASVSLERYELGHPFYNLEGSNSVVSLLTERYNPHPMIIQGYGAGAGVTAAGVFDDIIAIA